jgi:hypothetical protein
VCILKNKVQALWNLRRALGDDAASSLLRTSRDTWSGRSALSLVATIIFAIRYNACDINARRHEAFSGAGR